MILDVIAGSLVALGIFQIATRRAPEVFRLVPNSEVVRSSPFAWWVECSNDLHGKKHVNADLGISIPEGQALWFRETSFTVNATEGSDRLVYLRRTPGVSVIDFDPSQPNCGRSHCNLDLRQPQKTRGPIEFRVSFDQEMEVSTVAKGDRSLIHYQARIHYGPTDHAGPDSPIMEIEFTCEAL